MMQLVAFYESQAGNSALQPIAAVSDQTLTTSGDDVTVPAAINQLICEAALTEVTTPSYAQVEAPSLRGLANQDIEPVIAALKFGSNPPVQAHVESPRKMVSGEKFNMSLYCAGTTAGVMYGLAWLADAAPKPVSGEIFSLRATGAASLSAGQWVNTALTFEETLPDGSYQVVGLRAEGANLVAARLVFIGQANRPGVPAVNAVGDRDWEYSRMGTLGAFGQFDVNQPPTMDCLGVTDTSQAFVLDLIKVK